jgi:serine/threonine protein kinase
MSNQLGRYELIRLLGSGASSEVYLARDMAANQPVALKVLRPALIQDGSSFARFTQEARAAGGLRHPHIATVLEMGEAEGRYFIAMRYVDGPSLDHRLREGGALSLEDSLRLARQIGGALDYAHKAGFIHRDVKPANILCTADGNFVLTDFGLTKALMSTGLSSHSGAILGTPAYIAPEVWLNQPVTPATDQYALACVICEALSGQVLFQGDTPPAIMTSHMMNGPRFPTRWPAGVPKGIEAVLARGLARDPAKRHPSLLAFVQELFRFAPKSVPSKATVAAPKAVAAPGVGAAPAPSSNRAGAAGAPTAQPVATRSPQPASRQTSAAPTPGAAQKKRSSCAIFLLVAGLVLVGIIMLGMIGMFVIRLLSSPPPAAVEPPPTSSAAATATDAPSAPVELSSTATTASTVTDASTSTDCTNIAEIVPYANSSDTFIINPGKGFSIVWRVKNIGTCTWTTDYGAFFFAGFNMGIPTFYPLTNTVPPGEEINITIPFRAPAQPGSYMGIWKLRSADGIPFGVGTDQADGLPVYIAVQ